jgi:hypothetical protein
MASIAFNIINEVSKDDKKYIVLSMYENDLLPEGSVPNLVAVDKKGNIIWLAEPPTTAFDRYSNIYFEDNKLLALSAGSQLHHIDERTGKIISSRMIK